MELKPKPKIIEKRYCVNVSISFRVFSIIKENMRTIKKNMAISMYQLDSKYYIKVLMSSFNLITILVNENKKLHIIVKSIVKIDFSVR